MARIGALIEGPGFYPYLSGRDNLRVLARYRGLPRHARSSGSLERVDLPDRGGDRVQVLLAGHEAAARCGRGPARRPGPARARRADERAGPGRHGRHAPAAGRSSPPAGRPCCCPATCSAEVQEICDRVGIVDHGRLLAESTVAELRGVRASCVRAEPVDVALAVAMRMAGDDAVERVDAPPADGRRRGLRLAAPRSWPQLTRALVAAGADVHELHPRALAGRGVLRPDPTPGPPDSRARRLRHDRHDRRAAGPTGVRTRTRAGPHHPGRAAPAARGPPLWVLVGVWSRST